LHESYLGLLNQAGTTARQAQVTQEALQVVYEQANESRDQIAGVNLDEEAANLIRFQQSYQASARMIQTANQLFDAILRL
jgi:flagellar hook-associated protein 1 FlgK